MKLYKSFALATALIAQSAVVAAAPRLANLTLAKSLPEITAIKLPVLGGLGITDLPLIGGYFVSVSQLGLNQDVALLTHGGGLLVATSQNFVPLLTGSRGQLPGLGIIGKLKGQGGRGSGAIIHEPLNPRD